MDPLGPNAAGTPPCTFLAALEHLDPAPLARVLEQRGWTPLSRAMASDAGHADLVLTEGNFCWDRELSMIPCGYKSRLDAPVLTCKIRLHARMLASSTPAVVAPSVIASPGGGPVVSVDFSRSAWIWRPEGGWAGKGVKILRTPADLKKAIREMHTRVSPKRALVSRYENRPMLIPRFSRHLLYKFHVRIYMLAVADTHGKRVALYRNGYLIYARKPYRDVHQVGKVDMSVHDTHWVGRYTPGYFPDDFTTVAGVSVCKEVWKQIQALTKNVAEACMGDVKPYPECARGGFEVFGCDFMVSSGGQVWLVEINTKPGFSPREPYRSRMSAAILGGITDYAVPAGRPVAGKHLVECWREPH